MTVSRTVPVTPPILAPSILSADFSRLGDQLAVADPERDWIHCDVMDNHFVPNLTFGPIVIAAARKLASGFLDVHLMIENPERIVPRFLEAGADQITVHLEAQHDRGLLGVFEMIREGGARAGLALKPGTQLERAMPFLRKLDLLLVMTVEPGFGGQNFMADQMAKVTAAREWRSRNGAGYLIQVDGGITSETAAVARAAGAEVFVAGHSIYGAENPAMAIATLRAAVRS